ncbi:hypothetical protein HUJ05_005921 [Dendroctonus ponderosae]|nr:hypothetical protein HUJ05_005921 [Dendroctonus ponderosae]
MAGENFSNLERLRQETLNLARTGHNNSSIPRMAMISYKPWLESSSCTETGPDYLQGFVVLQNLLHTTGNVVVFLPDNVGVHDTRG